MARENDDENNDDDDFVNDRPEMSVSFFGPTEEINVARDMDDFTYNTVIIILAVLVAIVSSKCDDLTLIFGMFGAFCETWFDFIFPAILFFSALNHVKSHKTNVRIPAILLGIAGVGQCFMANYCNYKKI